MTTEEIEKIRAEWAHWRGLQNDSPVLTIQRLLAEVDRLNTGSVEVLSLSQLVHLFANLAEKFVRSSLDSVTSALDNNSSLCYNAAGLGSAGSPFSDSLRLMVQLSGENSASAC